MPLSSSETTVEVPRTFVTATPSDTSKGGSTASDAVQHALTSSLDEHAASPDAKDGKDLDAETSNPAPSGGQAQESLLECSTTTSIKSSSGHCSGRTDEQVKGEEEKEEHTPSVHRPPAISEERLPHTEEPAHAFEFEDNSHHMFSALWLWIKTSWAEHLTFPLTSSYMWSRLEVASQFVKATLPGVYVLRSVNISGVNLTSAKLRWTSFLGEGGLSSSLQEGGISAEFALLMCVA
eukprot:CAMPEP_0176414266 /NCGR_PEP_ID=MMETSP0127-20121128/5169_1 /TAXON_ID=938130 /ORGANISM="Platyophrya macrostoma, Strain WH" /LENGTH=235 /DNA_ID=CAMNT_0017794159 /DNA_START=231 /DNA_END=935 /DNA_ORIENTATION=-